MTQLTTLHLYSLFVMGLTLEERHLHLIIVKLIVKRIQYFENVILLQKSIDDPNPDSTVSTEESSITSLSRTCGSVDEAFNNDTFTTSVVVIGT